MMTKLLYLTLLPLLSAQSFADQPIMNMMPRWDGGYGFQVRSEYTHRGDLLQGDRIIGAGFSEDIHQLHLEGVYTWDKSIRLTMKLPYVLDGRREQLGLNGAKDVEHTDGFGDMTIALPLKKYFNLDGRSGSWTFSPQVRIPTRSRMKPYDVYDRYWGVGLGLGYETETATAFFSTGISGWAFESEDTNELSGHIDLGWTFRDNAQILWETDFKWEDDNSQTLSAGPALYWRFTDTVHCRLEWKHDFISKVGMNELDHGNGDRISLGLGFVW